MKNLILSFIVYFFSKFNIAVFNNTKKNYLNEFLKKIFIWNCGHQLIRIGHKKDGGYVVPDILNEIEYCFSPGVGTISSFEDELLNKYNIKSFLADNSVEYFDRHDFKKKHLNTFNNEKNITLDSWVNEKIVDKKNDKLILQMDIESNEFAIIYNASMETLKRFKIMVIEFHDFNNLRNFFGFKIFNDVFDKILKNHTIVHAHPCNGSGYTYINSYKVPKIIEFTFIRNDLIKSKKKIDYDLPHPDFDFKNLPQKKDLYLPKIFYK